MNVISRLLIFIIISILSYGCMTIPHRQVVKEKEYHYYYGNSPELLILRDNNKYLYFIPDENWLLLGERDNCKLDASTKGRAKIYLYKKRIKLNNNANIIDCWTCLDFGSKGVVMESWKINYSNKTFESNGSIHQDERGNDDFYDTYWKLRFYETDNENPSRKCNPESIEEFIINKIILYKNENY